MRLSFDEAAVYAASFLDGLDQGLGTAVEIEVEDIDLDRLERAAKHHGVDVETFVLAAVVYGLQEVA